MGRSVFFDTQIITQVSDGQIPADIWSHVVAAVRQKYAYCVTLTTFLELLNALAGGDEGNFKGNRRRLLTLTDVPGYQFLPLPGQFIRHAVLNLPLEWPEFSPATMKQWMAIISAARTKRELATGVPMGTYALGVELTMGIDLNLVRKQMEYGQSLWREELRLAKDGGKDMPPKNVYSEFILHFDARAETSAENVSKLTRALDAAYCHLAVIHHQSTKSTYKYDCKPQDWIDNQQLMYLADPDCTFITADRKLITKLEKSTQRARVRDFNEFVANP